MTSGASEASAGSVVGVGPHDKLRNADTRPVVAGWGKRSAAKTKGPRASAPGPSIVFSNPALRGLLVGRFEGPRPPVFSIVSTPPVTDQVAACSRRSRRPVPGRLLVMTSFDPSHFAVDLVSAPRPIWLLVARCRRACRSRDFVLAPSTRSTLSSVAVCLTVIGRRPCRVRRHRRRPAAAAAGSTSGAQLPEKSGLRLRESHRRHRQHGRCDNSDSCPLHHETPLKNETEQRRPLPVTHVQDSCQTSAVCYQLRALFTRLSSAMLKLKAEG